MRKDGSGEFYNAKQDNVFSEYKLFRAEKYYSSEFSKTPEEVQSYNESYHDEGVKSTKSEEKNSSDAKELQKQYDKLHQSGSSDAPQTSGTPSGGNPLQTTAASQTAGSVSSGVATVTGGASVGATAVAAVIIVSAAITGGFIADFNSYIGNDPGRDYISITVDMDELLSQADRSYRLSADNFSIELTEGGVSRKIALVDGKHSYLITGLQPDKTYTYNFICNNSSLGSNSNCYSQTFTTLSVAEPKGVYDELNNYVVYDEISQSATVFYSVYLSDYDRQFPDAALYLCSSEHTDLTSIDHIVYSDVAPDENGFFRGEVGGITYDELYLYVVGESTTEDGTKAVELFSIKLTLDIPEEWQAARNPAFEIDESAEKVAYYPDRLSVSGSISGLNELYDYYAYVVQYDAGSEAFAERQEADFTFDTEKMTYALDCGACYGLKNYKYVIYAQDGDGNEVTVYDSGEKVFSASQAFGATYTKIEPANAGIEYTASGAIVTVDPEFTSEYENYYYKLVVTNGAGAVYGEYAGTGVAVIEIADVTGLDEIHFTYYDFGSFINGEIEYASHSTSGVTGQARFEIDESAEVLTYFPDRLSVSGSISGLNELYDYYAYVVQYDAGGEAFAERQEADFTFDTEKMTYALDCGACYGLANYKYVIYAQDGDGNEVTVYDSGEKVFSASQAFGATYTKIEPANAEIEYTASGAIVTVDPEFTSEYENYYYKLVVTNGAGAVYGEYAGTGVAVIEIADVTGLDEIHFTYYDFGLFINGEIEYASHSTSGVTGQARFEIDESAEVLTYLPDRLSVRGSISGLNELYDYYAYVVQYDAGGEAFAERQEADFTFDTEKMTYALDCGACYGLANYKYVIYAQDGDGNEVTVYDSGEKVFSASQAFGATYTKIEPANAEIEYTASGAIVTVDPEFTSEYENYYYKLVVTNGAGAVYGEYAGTGVAVIEIPDVTGLDEIYFTYYDFGSFINGEIEYASHLAESVAFCLPKASFGSECGFNGQYFTLSYACDMIYDYATASMDISVSDGTHVYVKHVDGIAESGTIVLDHIEGEVGNVTVTGTLNFKDNQSDGATHSVSIDQAVYAMNYSLEVTNVLADISGFSSETMLVTLELEYRLPENYVIAISDEDNSFSFISDLTRQVSFSELPMEAEANLTVQVMDGNGNVWGAPKTISISPSAAWAEFVYPMMCSPNPGDAVVTYNDDGTINIYRMMIPDEYGMDTVSGDERVYYNAFVQGFYLDSDGAVYTDGYDVIGRGKYAVIENIPNQNYFFIYYTMFDYSGVSYAMYAEMPSGSVENVYECGDAIVSYGDGNTIINLMVIKSGMIANYILVNGVEYEFDSYTDESDTDLIVFFEGEAEVREVTILFTAQGYNYDEYAASGEITMKGNKYASHVIQVIFAEM